MGRGSTGIATAYAERDAAGPEASDEVLVAAVRGGDDRAFEALYDRYQRRISAYARGLIRDDGRAEDITQEIFLSAIRRMRETGRPIAFKPWIYEIARNAAIDEFRRARRTHEVSFEVVGDTEDELAALGRLTTRPQSPDAAVDQKQALRDLCGAFSGLSDAHHEVLILRELEGLSYREIGDRLGLSQAAVEATLFRARRRLSEEYEQFASGESCAQTQSLMVPATAGLLGARDLRRFAQHVAHCEVCRRDARVAGVDAAILATSSRRRSVARKIGSLFPLPAFWRKRRAASSGESGLWLGGGGRATGVVVQLSAVAPTSEPVATGWSKTAAAAATLVLAGIGAGVGSHVGGGPLGDQRPQPLVARANADPSPKRASARSGGRGAASPSSGVQDPRGGMGVAGSPAPGGSGGRVRPSGAAPGSGSPPAASPKEASNPSAPASNGSAPAGSEAPEPAPAPAPARPFTPRDLTGQAIVTAPVLGPVTTPLAGGVGELPEVPSPPVEDAPPLNEPVVPALPAAGQAAPEVPEIPEVPLVPGLTAGSITPPAAPAGLPPVVEAALETVGDLDLAVPALPALPDLPLNVVPVVPALPDLPLNVVPAVPLVEAPALPGLPEVPAIEAPALPALPDLPAVPAAEAPALPALPEPLALPDLPAVDLPALPVLPAVPAVEAPALPSVPALPEVPAIDAPALPALPAMPAAEAPAVPALPEPPALPNLPEVAFPDPPAVAVPELPEVAVPDPPAVAVPELPEVAVPDPPAVAVPTDPPAVEVPDPPAAEVPDPPAIEVPDAPAAQVPDVPEAPAIEAPAPAPPTVPAAEAPDSPPVAADVPTAPDPATATPAPGLPIPLGGG